MSSDTTRKKRARSAYILYSIDERPKIKDKYPNKGIGEISQVIAKNWNALDDMTKEKYKKKSEREKTALAANPVYVKKKMKRSKKENNGIKRPKNAFMFFANEKRGEIMKLHPDWKVGQIGKELGKRWKELPNSKKEKYEELNKKDKARYERELKKYKENKK